MSAMPLPGTPDAKALNCTCMLGQPSGTESERNEERDWGFLSVTVWVIEPTCPIHREPKAWYAEPPMVVL